MMIRERGLLRSTAYALFAFFLFLLGFSNLNTDMKALIAFLITICFIFLIVYIKSGIRKLKMFIIVFSFISIPASIVYFSGILNDIPGPWNGIVLLIVVSVSALASLFTIIRLNLIERVSDDEGNIFLK